MPEAADATEGELRRRIEKLERINAALMSHVERITDRHEGAYSLFQTAIVLDGRVRRRTEELTGLMHALERSNSALEAARDEAEQANRSKTRFLAAASHDLLQPLHAARLSISTIADMPLGSVAAGVLQRVERGLAEIDELIRTLLDISKLDAGVVEPSLGAVALAALLGEVEEGFRQQAEARGLRLVLRCPDGLLADSDGKLLARIVGNLVSNAVRYTASGGVLIAARRRGGRCRIDVVDTGRGIPATEHGMVFEEFYRGQSSGDGEKGLGLGLSIVRRMASTLGHELSFRSRPGHGTWFTLVLPLRGGEDMRPPRRPGAPTATGVRRILLVADAGAERDAMRSLLEGWDMGVTVAPPASVAVMRAGIGEGIDEGMAAPDLVLVDHAEADDGATLVAVLRRRFAREVPAVVLARAGDAAVAITGCRLLQRPARPAQLRSLLAALLG